MKKLLVVLMLLFAVSAYGADVNLSWDASTGATGYKLYMSTDNGVVWMGETDVGDVLTYVYPLVPDSGLVLFRVSTYNSVGESIRFWSGAWYNGDWKPVNSPSGIGIK